MLLITLRDLQHRASRTFVVTILVALVLTLLFLMTGLVNQLLTEPFRSVQNLGGTHWVVGEGVSGPFTSVSTLPADTADEVGGSPLVVSRGTLFTDDGLDTEVVIMGVDRGRDLTPDPVEGRLATDASEIVVDDTLGIDVGTSVEIAGTDYTVVGLTSDTSVLAGLPFAFLDIGDAQDVSFDTRAVISAVVVDGDPGDVDGAAVRVAEDVADDALGPLDSAVTSIDLIRGLLWVVAAIVVGAVVYLGALERERDFAVMKAVGVSGRSLAGGLALQAVLVAVLAAVVAAGIATVVEPVFPLAVRVPDGAYVQVPVVAALVALVVAGFGARRANGVDPASAFGGAR